MSVSCEDSSASGEKEYIIPQLPSDRGWSLDQTGKLVISNQTGMNNWANSGNQDNKEVVREIQIQEGLQIFRLMLSMDVSIQFLPLFQVL